MNSTLKRVFASIVLAQMGFQTVSALPSFSMPKVSMPSISMPKVSMPSFSMPSMPESVSSKFEDAKTFVTPYAKSVSEAVAPHMTLQNGKYAAAGVITLAGLYAGYKGVKAFTGYKIGKNLNFLGFLGSSKNEAQPAVVKADWKAQVLNAVKANEQELALSLVKDNQELTRVIKGYFTAVNAKWDALKVSQRLASVEVQLRNA